MLKSTYVQQTALAGRNSRLHIHRFGAQKLASPTNVHGSKLRATSNDSNSSHTGGQAGLVTRTSGLQHSPSSQYTAAPQQQQQYYATAAAAGTRWPHTQANSYTTITTAAPVSTGAGAATPNPTAVEAAAAAADATPIVPAPAAGLLAGVATLGERHMLHVHIPFAAFFCYLGVMAAAASSSDWYMDVAAFGTIWAGLWAICCRWKPSPRTVVLMNLLPLLHLTGALGTYDWELGNLSWDILVHISNGFIGTLLFAAVLSDLTSPGRSQAGLITGPDNRSGSGWHQAGLITGPDNESMPQSPIRLNPEPHTKPWDSYKPVIWRFVQVSVLLIAGTSLIEVIENLGGQVAGTGEGIFLRGPGDFCSASVPCSEEVDTAKDMVDNVAGMLMALVALATGGGGGRHNR